MFFFVCISIPHVVHYLINGITTYIMESDHSLIAISGEAVYTYKYVYIYKYIYYLSLMDVDGSCTMLCIHH